MKTTINNKLGVITVALLLSGLVPSTMMAQDKVEASVWGRFGKWLHLARSEFRRS